MYSNISRSCFKGCSKLFFKTFDVVFKLIFKRSSLREKNSPTKQLLNNFFSNFIKIGGNYKKINFLQKYNNNIIIRVDHKRKSPLYILLLFKTVNKTLLMFKYKWFLVIVSFLFSVRVSSADLLNLPNPQEYQHPLPQQISSKDF